MKILLFFLILSGNFAQASVAPSFQVDSLDGQSETLAGNLKSGRYLLLCFWATWCEPCLQELVSLKKQLSEKPKMPVDLFTINVDSAESQNQVRPTLKLYGFEFRVALDPKHDAFKKYNSSETLPYSVLINSKGEIVTRFSAFSEEMVSKIEKLTGTNGAP